MKANKQSWVVRKGVYFILGGLLAIAAIFGWITTDQADEWLAIADKVVASVAAAGLIFAGTKTHKGSDDDTTKDDVVEAAKTPAESFTELRDKLDDLRARLARGTETVTTSAAVADDAAKGGIYPAGQ